MASAVAVALVAYSSVAEMAFRTSLPPREDNKQSDIITEEERRRQQVANVEALLAAALTGRREIITLAGVICFRFQCSRRNAQRQAIERAVLRFGGGSCDTVDSSFTR